MYASVPAFFVVALLMCATVSHAESQACLQEEPTYPSSVTTAPAWYRNKLAHCPWDSVEPRTRATYGTYVRKHLLNEIRAYRVAEQLCLVLTASNHHETALSGIAYCRAANHLLYSTRDLTVIMRRAFAPWIGQ